MVNSLDLPTYADLFGVLKSAAFKDVCISMLGASICFRLSRYWVPHPWLLLAFCWNVLLKAVFVVAATTPVLCFLCGLAFLARLVRLDPEYRVAYEQGVQILWWVALGPLPIAILVYCLNKMGAVRFADLSFPRAKVWKLISRTEVIENSNIKEHSNVLSFEALWSRPHFEGEERTVPLRLEPIPFGGVSVNLRTVLPKENWDFIRKRVYKEFSYRCSACGKKSKASPLHAHEVWNFDEEAETQRLKRIVALCVPCHQATHANFGTSEIDDQNAFRQFLKVNRWSEEQLRSYIGGVAERLSILNKILWKVDFSYLKHFGFSEQEVKEAERLGVEVQKNAGKEPTVGPGGRLIEPGDCGGPPSP